MECYLVTYDTPNDKRRTRIANLLQGYGQRVQFSVFEVWLDDRNKRKLLRELEKVISSQEDSVRLYWLCAACQKRVTVLGQGKPPQPPAAIII